MPRDILSEQQCNIEFVKAVEKHPCLYNYKLPAYTRKDISDIAWEEVAQAANMTPSACRERWRNLRAVFIRTVKQKINGNKKKPYYLADVMQFIIPFIQPTNMTEADKQRMQNTETSRSETSRKRESRAPSLEVELEEIKVENVDDDSSFTAEDWSIENAQSSSLKRHLLADDQYDHPTPSKWPATSSRAPVDTTDHVTSFVKSLMPELHEMNAAQFKAFKRRVLVLIDDITGEIPSTGHNDNDYIS